MLIISGSRIIILSSISISIPLSSDVLVYCDGGSHLTHHSKIIKQNLNPVWDEQCPLPPMARASTRDLRIEVWDSDADDAFALDRGTDDFLGEIELTLTAEALGRGPVYYKLNEKPGVGSRRVGVRGRVQLSFQEDTFNAREAARAATRDVRSTKKPCISSTMTILAPIALLGRKEVLCVLCVVIAW